MEDVGKFRGRDDWDGEFDCSVVARCMCNANLARRILAIRLRQKCHSVVSRTQDTERRAAKTWLSQSISLPRLVHSLSMDSIS